MISGYYVILKELSAGSVGFGETLSSRKPLVQGEGKQRPGACNNELIVS